jgi:transcription elongation GreA/GreB family factor
VNRRSFEEYRSSDLLGALDDDWLQAIEETPDDLDYFLSLAEPLAEAGEAERARDLLELYLDELGERRLWSVRLDLLRRAGKLAVKPNRLQKEVLSTLEAIWGDRPTFREMVEHVGLHRSIDEPAKIWDRATRLQSLLLYDVGAVVAMSGQGVGRVAEVNLPLESLKIDFDKKSGVTVGFRAAAKLLKPLPEGHLLRRQIEDPEGLARLRDENPAELLRAALETSEKPMTAAEIRELLAGIVDTSQWTSWWAAARKHPQVTASTGGRPADRWEASAAGALASVRGSFDRAEPRARLEIFRKNSTRDEALAREMAGDLASTAAEVADSQPGLAFEIWFTLERAGRLPEALDPVIEQLVGAQADASALLTGVEDRLLRERALAMMRERRADWLEVYRDHFVREADPRVLSLLFDGIAERSPEAAERLLDDLMAQPRRSPAAFVWLVERAAEEESLRTRSPLRLIQQLLASMIASEFTPFRARLRPLVESGGTLPRLFPHLEEDQAKSALESIRRSAALETYQKEPLANALVLRFPILREESTGGPIYSTTEAIAAKRSELKRLQEVEIPANRKAIEEARAMGDLRENFEYKSARERHEYLNARVAALHRDLGRARPIEFAKLDPSEVRIGCRVHLVGEAGIERAFTLLGPWDSQPEKGILSYESELARAILGRKVGEPVRVGEASFEVVAIEPYRAD